MQMLTQSIKSALTTLTVLQFNIVETPSRAKGRGHVGSLESFPFALSIRGDECKGDAMKGSKTRQITWATFELKQYGSGETGRSKTSYMTECNFINKNVNK